MRGLMLVVSALVAVAGLAEAQGRYSEPRRPRPPGENESRAPIEASFDFGPWFRFRYAPDDDRVSFRSALSRISCGACRFGRCSDREWDAYQRCQDRSRDLEKKEAEWRRDAEKRRDEFERDMAKREREFRKKEYERYRNHEREMAERWRELEHRR